MKKIHRVLAMLMAAIMALSLITTAFAEPTIDPSKKASLSIYKYDITTASAEGAWDAESYVSTGLHDDAVVDKLAKYAIQGVEFTCLRVADVTMNNEVVDGQRTVGVLYGFDSSDRSNAVLSAIGLTAADAHKTDNGINYFTSDTLNNKLSAALTANATTVKNALEAAVKNGGMAMPETDAAGHTSASNMEQGLYLVVETRVPENVTSTCNPFFVSLPMTTIDGTAWNYDVTVYPKNQTGNPTLDIRMLENSESADPVIEQKLWELSHALEQVDGKHVYAYLPKEVKTQVDEIMEQLAQLPEVAACYDQWWRLKDEIAGYYGRNTPPHQPLVQQKEFRTIKNFIIREAETLREPTPVQASADAEQDKPQESSTETLTAVQQPQPAPLQNALTADAVMQLLHHMSRMFRSNMPVIPLVLRIDSKRRRRLQEKRMAMGHKRDDHEDEQLYHVNDNTMQ